ncbi:hypothetical protein [Arthrobacter methylotrophus]|uniref:hypothetical protein n=1 Tax=Arthrobacter methylotrophus TaxID=121291 RepID=UPI0031F12080
MEFGLSRRQGGAAFTAKPRGFDKVASNCTVLAQSVNSTDSRTTPIKVTISPDSSLKAFSPSPDSGGDDGNECVAFIPENFS